MQVNGRLYYELHVWGITIAKTRSGMPRYLICQWAIPLGGFFVDRVLIPLAEWNVQVTSSKAYKFSLLPGIFADKEFRLNDMLIIR